MATSLLCAKCNRRGRCRFDRLIAQHGKDPKITDWVHYVARACPRLKAAR